MTENPTHIMTFLSLLLVIIIDTMGVGLILPVIGPLFLQTNGGIFSPETSNTVRNILFVTVISGYFVTMFLGAPLLGDWSDSWGRKKVLIICMLGTAVTLLVAALGVLWHSLILLLIGRVVGGFVASTQPIAQAVIVDISAPGKKAANMGLMVFAACIGFIIGPIIGSYFADSHVVNWFNPATPFFIAVILSLFNAILLMCFFQETYFPLSKKKIQITKAVSLFIAAFQHSKVRLFSAILLLMEAAFGSYFIYITLYLIKKFHYNTTMIGHYMTFLGLIWAVTFLLLVKLVLRWLSLRHLILLGLFILALCFALCSIESEIGLWLLTIPLAIFNGLTYTALLAILSDSVDENSQGWVMGISTSVIAASWAVGALLAGVLGSLGDSLPFIAAALITLMAFILLWFSKTGANQAI